MPIFLSNRKEAKATPIAPRKIGNQTRVRSFNTSNSSSPVAEEAMDTIRKAALIQPRTFFSLDVWTMIDEVICIGIAAMMLRQSNIVIRTTQAITGKRPLTPHKAMMRSSRYKKRWIKSPQKIAYWSDTSGPV